MAHNADGASASQFAVRTAKAMEKADLKLFRKQGR